MASNSNATGYGTIAGTVTSGDVIKATINGTLVSHTVTATDAGSAALAAEATAAAINANATTKQLVWAYADGSTGKVYIVAQSPGTAGSSITLACSVTGVCTFTANTSTLYGSIDVINLPLYLFQDVSQQSAGVTSPTFSHSNCTGVTLDFDVLNVFPAKFTAPTLHVQGISSTTYNGYVTLTPNSDTTAYYTILGTEGWATHAGTYKIWVSIQDNTFTYNSEYCYLVVT